MANQLGTSPGGAQLATQITGGSGGGVTSVTATSPIASSGGATPNITHLTSGVVAAAYTKASVTVDAKGHVTTAASGAADQLVLLDTQTLTAANTYTTPTWVA